MKIKFLKNYIFAFYVFVSITFWVLITSAMILILVTNNVSINGVIISLSIVILPFIIFIIILLVYRKSIFKIIKVDEIGLTISSKNQEFINWNDIKSIYSKFSINGFKNLYIEYKNGKTINFHVNQNIVNTFKKYIKQEKILKDLENVNARKYRTTKRSILNNID